MPAAMALLASYLAAGVPPPSVAGAPAAHAPKLAPHHAAVRDGGATAECAFALQPAAGGSWAVVNAVDLPGLPAQVSAPLRRARHKARGAGEGGATRQKGALGSRPSCRPRLTQARSDCTGPRLTAAGALRGAHPAPLVTRPRAPS